ncbi:MAG: YkgJ family cysteine cluster protein [Candidatus Bathyarchaeota archaeon]|nr:YkgJ family cysteine cluster protein [Candidatus Bathyarchaeota archaeon]
MDFDYPNALRFKCIKCAKCCGDTTEKTRHILLLREEAEKIAKATQQPVSVFAVAIADKSPYAFEMRKTARDGKCVFLADNRCSIYTLRPLVCRFYPFELKPNKARRHTFSYTDECSGVNMGEQLDEAFFRKLFQLACDKLGEPEKKVKEKKITGKTDKGALSAAHGLRHAGN